MAILPPARVCWRATSFITVDFGGLMRAQIVWSMALLAAAIFVQQAGAQAQSAIPTAAEVRELKDWYIETKRAAKYARIAITSTGDLLRLNVEERAASRQLATSYSLPLPKEGLAICVGAARAVVDFISAAKAGNMDAGPASYEKQHARWERLREPCLESIFRQQDISVGVTPRPAPSTPMTGW